MSYTITVPIITKELRQYAEISTVLNDPADVLSVIKLLSDQEGFSLTRPLAGSSNNGNDSGDISEHGEKLGPCEFNARYAVLLEYTDGKTGEFLPYVGIYNDNPNLEYPWLQVYPEDFHKLPPEIETKGKRFEGACTLAKAQAKNVLIPLYDQPIVVEPKKTYKGDVKFTESGYVVYRLTRFGSLADSPPAITQQATQPPQRDATPPGYKKLPPVEEIELDCFNQEAVGRLINRIRKLYDTTKPVIESGYLNKMLNAWEEEGVSQPIWALNVLQGHDKYPSLEIYNDLCSLYISSKAIFIKTLRVISDELNATYGE